MGIKVRDNDLSSGGDGTTIYPWEGTGQRSVQGQGRDSDLPVGIKGRNLRSTALESFQSRVPELIRFPFLIEASSSHDEAGEYKMDK